MLSLVLGALHKTLEMALQAAISRRMATAEPSASTFITQCASACYRRFDFAICATDAMKRVWILRWNAKRSVSSLCSAALPVHALIVQDVDPEGGNVSQSTRLHHKTREMNKVTCNMLFRAFRKRNCFVQVNDLLADKKTEYARRIKAVKKGEARFLQKASMQARTQL